jgi:hypothetical protein
MSTVSHEYLRMHCDIRVAQKNCLLGSLHIFMTSSKGTVCGYKAI